MAAVRLEPAADGEAAPRRRTRPNATSGAAIRASDSPLASIASSSRRSSSRATSSTSATMNASGTRELEIVRHAAAPAAARKSRCRCRSRRARGSAAAPARASSRRRSRPGSAGTAPRRRGPDRGRAGRIGRCVGDSASRDRRRVSHCGVARRAPSTRRRATRLWCWTDTASRRLSATISARKN